MVKYTIMLEIKLPEEEKNKQHTYDNDLEIKYNEKGDPYVSLVYDVFELPLESYVDFRNTNVYNTFLEKVSVTNSKIMHEKLPFNSDDVVYASLYDGDRRMGEVYVPY